VDWAEPRHLGIINVNRIDRLLGIILLRGMS
jgi:hypothetical protein